MLATLVEAYERRHYPLDAPDPVAAIKFRKLHKGLGIPAESLIKPAGKRSAA